MRYLSICSGIEAATVAWHPLGWTPAAFAEIDAFPSAVLAAHYPGIPNLGDFTRIEAADVGPVDVLVGGTPCQSFSIAGLRGGLADDRGNLALEFLRLAQRTRPRWLVWENVPGVLSSNGGRDFGAILGGMVECGYGFAYRVLDAQYFGLAQRRKRVFVVGYLGDWRPAAAVLFERESLSGHPAPRRQARQDVAGTLAAGAHPSGFNGRDAERGNIVPAVSTGGRGIGDFELGGGLSVSHTLNGKDGDPMFTLQAGAQHAVAFDCKASGRNGFGVGDIAPTLRAMGHADSHQNAGGHVAVAFDTTQVTSKANRSNPKPGDPSHPLAAKGHAPAVALSLRGREGGATAEISGDVMPALRTGGGGGDKPHALGSFGVRRLTPRECERLQGFPDDYTLVPLPLKRRQTRQRWAADGPRYRALGNSMAVPVMRWIGAGIAATDAIMESSP